MVIKRKYLESECIIKDVDYPHTDSLWRFLSFRDLAKLILYITLHGFCFNFSIYDNCIIMYLHAVLCDCTHNIDGLHVLDIDDSLYILFYDFFDDCLISHSITWHAIFGHIG